MSEELVVRDVAISRSELSTQDVLAQVEKIQEVMALAMKEDEHYGVIPGTNKPTLLKPGAEKLCLTFRLDPEYDIREKIEDDGHYTVTATCTLYHIPTGDRIASGLGLCSTHESKYAWRKASRHCLVCGADAIIKGKAEYGGGWLCFARRGGCGMKWPDGAGEIESQEVGRVPNPDLWDCHNTVLKMAAKRALVATVLNATAASDLFTQDLEDRDEREEAPVMSVARADQRAEIERLKARLTDEQRTRLNEWWKDTAWRMSTLTVEQADQTIATLRAILAETAEPSAVANGARCSSCGAVDIVLDEHGLCPACEPF